MRIEWMKAQAVKSRACRCRHPEIPTALVKSH